MGVSSGSRRIAVLVLVALVGVVLAMAAPASGSANASKLSLRAVQLTPGSVQAGGSITLLGNLVNRRRRASSRDLKVLLEGPSAGGTITLDGPRISARGRSRRGFAFNVALPDRLAEGLYSILVCAPKRRVTAGGPCSRAGRNLTVLPHPSGPPTGPAPAPGPRTLGDPLFPEVGNGGYDVQHYDVNLDWTLPDNFQAGTNTTITAKATQGLSDFSLDFEGLTVSAVRVNGVAASFSREVPAACSEAPDPCPPTKLVITPATPIDDGSTFTVEVDYTGNPQRHTDPDGSDEGWIDTTDGAFVVNEPIGAMTWMPCNNHPKDRATYDTTITVPIGKTGVGNGELVSHQDTVTTSTWHWKSDATMPTYLSTATIGNFYLDQQTTSTGLPIYNFIDSMVIATGLTSLMPEQGIFDFFSVLYGPYPFDSAGAVIDDAPDVGYALEVQTKPHFGLPVVDAVTLAHEYSHQWFGDNVTLTTWKDIWLNEGWATWSEQDWDYQENGGTSPADDFTSNYTPGTKWNTAPTNPTAAGLFSTFPTYTRPGMMLEALRQILGDAKFLQLARTWQSDHRQGNATTAQFIALAEQVSGFSGATLNRLDTFFQQWLYGTTMPTITGSNF